MLAFCFRTTILMKDDVLCHFGFCSKRVEIEGSDDDRIMNIEMFKAPVRKKSESHSFPKPKEKTSKRKKASAPAPLCRFVGEAKGTRRLLEERCSSELSFFHNLIPGVGPSSGSGQ